MYLFIFSTGQVQKPLRITIIETTERLSTRNPSLYVSYLIYFSIFYELECFEISTGSLLT